MSDDPLPEYDLQLFISGTNPKSATALKNIQAICAQYLAGRYALTILDVQTQPELAITEELLGLPCLIKKRPGLVQRLVGDLSDRARVVKMLGVE